MCERRDRIAANEVKIVVVGSSNMDLVVKTPRIPALGETILGGDFLMVPGGKGANQAVAAARLGADVCFVARLGDDLFGRRSLENFKQAHVDTRHVTLTADVPSGVALSFWMKSANSDTWKRLMSATLAIFSGSLPWCVSGWWASATPISG